jgi:hypothetical protein
MGPPPPKSPPAPKINTLSAIEGIGARALAAVITRFKWRGLGIGARALADVATRAALGPAVWSVDI